MKTKTALSSLTVAVLALAGCRHPADTQTHAGSDVVLRIGYQRQSGLNLLRLRGDLEKKLAPKGVTVQWLPFPAGPQLMEGLGTGSIDLGSAGDTPPIFAQAAGSPFVYAANQPPGPLRGGGFLLPKGSPIRTTSDLRDKRVALQLGSGSTYWLVQVLNHAGLQYRDIHAVNLAPPDAQIAFSTGNIDAWVTWEPYVTISERENGARLLPDNSQTETSGGFYLASRTFAVAHPDLIKETLEETKAISDWSHAHPHEAAAILAPNLGLEIGEEEQIIRRGSTTGYRAIDENVIALQQKEADSFTKIGLIPKKIDVRQNTLTPQQYALLTPTDASKTVQASAKIAQ
ncbi:sulfonate ABC transporter substrate-binding protein [Capsulimonas corticalis]|uniref:Putative aliphatic sulfonates-binding protein n=1 Tax=Capsulimonas corticalis TaxID=2219043 RepID=A0A402CV37_9BACT|nr:aliphatic sulfonate ABC transporter substrate-binding protein [Capsulimonas corticalis]BDI30262.1 sulfonate ABC transporter substrate-binding protein [Capsulimonas corticalis]